MFSVCNHCRSVVDMHDTFKETCVECGAESSWDDSEETHRAVLERAQSARKYDDFSTPSG